MVTPVVFLHQLDRYPARQQQNVVARSEHD
jgi:hypothetical protein